MPTVKKQPYTRTEKVVIAWEKQIKQFNLSSTNNTYIEAFRNNKFPNWETTQKMSWAQYKSSVGNFLEQLNKDAVTITAQDIDSYLGDITNENTRANKTAHIKSFLSFIIKENVEDCRERADRDTLLLIVSI